MKKFRRFLVLAMAIAISGGIISVTNIVNAATKIDFGSTSILAGTARTWYPKGQTGYTLTNGQNQTISVTVSTKGNYIDIGFKQYSNSKYYWYYLGTLSTNSKTVTKPLASATASYRPYIANRNESVELKVTSGYARVQ